jgi:hypothetical protein
MNKNKARNRLKRVIKIIRKIQKKTIEDYFAGASRNKQIRIDGMRHQIYELGFLLDNLGKTTQSEYFIEVYKRSDKFKHRWRWNSKDSL